MEAIEMKLRTEIKFILEVWPRGGYRPEGNVSFGTYDTMRDVKLAIRRHKRYWKKLGQRPKRLRVWMVSTDRQTVPNRVFE